MGGAEERLSWLSVSHVGETGALSSESTVIMIIMTFRSHHPSIPYHY